MNKYESVMILKSDLKETEIKKVIDKFADLIKSNGTIESIEELGKKKLCYEIRKNKEGYYVIYYFESEPQFIIELERRYRITDEILKFIVVRKDD